jgi:UDP-4-amino-4,6-dideoxy-N-acetyl-beta-L-altrosamine transaminase
VRNFAFGLTEIEVTLAGSNTTRTIPYGRQDICDADIEAVVAVLRSDYLTQGPTVPRFEAAVAKHAGSRFAVASNSATSSLHLACRAIGIRPGDRVWTTPISFVASANCARYCGATVDFVDIDPVYYNMSARALAQKLERAEKNRTLPRAVIPVHLAGQPADMAEIGNLKQKYGFSVIEDASHAIGGRYRGLPIGNCKISDVTVFSFHPVKIITTGEGGMALTNDPELAQKMSLLNSHGITRSTDLMTRPADGPWYYEQLDLGMNYRLTDIQAALGLSQIARLDQNVARRHQLANRYDKLLARLPLRIPARHPDDYSALHLYIIRMNINEIGCSQRQVFERMRAAGILVNLHYIPIYRQPDFAQFGMQPEDFPESEAYYSEAMSLPIFPALSDDDQDYVVETLEKAISP